MDVALGQTILNYTRGAYGTVYSHFDCSVFEPRDVGVERACALVV